MELTSPTFANGQRMPAAHTNKGAGANPSLAVASTPTGAQSLALIMHDPDAPRGDFTHWLVWNLPAATAALTQGRLPSGAVEGLNDFGKTGYGPPAPPSGTHRYVFELYALDTQLSLPAGASRGALQAAMQGHVLAQSQLMGTVSAEG